MSATPLTQRIEQLVAGRPVKRVAAEWGVPHSTLNSYLKRGSEPTMAQLRKIAAGAGVSEQWLISGEGDAASRETAPPIGTHVRTSYAVEEPRPVYGAQPPISEFERRLNAMQAALRFATSALAGYGLNASEHGSFVSTLAELMMQDFIAPQGATILVQWYAFEQKARGVAIRLPPMGGEEAVPPAAGGGAAAA